MDLMTREISGTTGLETDAESENGNDLPPEYCRYRDEGCELAAACLECPFPRCLLEEPRGRQRWLKNSRDREMNRMHQEGWGVKDIAANFEVSLRTVQRALKRVEIATTVNGDGTIEDDKGEPR